MRELACIRVISPRGVVTSDIETLRRKCPVNKASTWLGLCRGVNSHG